MRDWRCPTPKKTSNYKKRKLHYQRHTKTKNQVFKKSKQEVNPIRQTGNNSKPKILNTQ